MPSLVSTITAAILLARACSAVQLSSTGTLVVCQKANLQAPCANCTKVGAGFNDKVQSVAAGYGMALIECTLYEFVFHSSLVLLTQFADARRDCRENCVNPGRSVYIQNLLSPSSAPKESTAAIGNDSLVAAAALSEYNVPDELKTEISNFKCNLAVV
ncbi:hypothetical protein C8F04DRAFT_1173206 [Mycena alexandri]|uniref:Uncharacterized protein n=1 Tax=Mycena alexandri TaxID=1745969 RepID=A0AAD6TJS0_9AGAR|nr:hypothetical protein C8F04DRAFT_1173206 [Mycena alexandri]